MKLPAQTLLLLALFSLLSLTFSQPVTISSENEESGETFTTEASTTETSTTETSTTTSTTETSTTVGGGLFTACDPSNRPQICTLEYAPVCGYIIGCVGGNCTATFGNDCGACGDAAVSGYVNGACEDAQTTCDPHNRPQICPLIFTATCAVASNCRGLNCFANASSSCNACSMTGVGYSLPGVCPGPDLSDVLQNCDPNNRPLICTADWNPVCAHLNNCVGRNCWSTAGNACSACADGNVDTYLVGDCPEFGTNNEEGFINEEEGFITEEAEGARTDCDASNRPTVCTADFTPVCAHTSGCEGDFADCTRTEANGCSACSQENVDYYYDGQCPF